MRRTVQENLSLSLKAPWKPKDDPEHYSQSIDWDYKERLFFSHISLFNLI